jgi:Fic family protein
MKIPQRPPDFRQTFKALARRPDRFQAAMEAAYGAVHRGEYLHWDKLRHLRPPDDLTSEEWWCVVRFARLQILKDLPLRDVSGACFHYATVDPMLESVHRIDRDASGRIEMGEQLTNPATGDRYLVRSLMEEAITSSQLEGAATTRKIAKQMLRSKRRPRDRGEQMILNNYRTIQQIGLHKREALTPELVLEFHELLTAETLDNPDAVGRLRHEDEKVEIATPYSEVIHTPPPAKELEGRMQAMCDFANGKTPTYFVHPVIRAIALHFWLAYDHPFVDGNGRTARALFYWSMLSQGYWLCEYISISQIIKQAPAKYGRAFLYTETDSNDMTHFIIYHLQVVERAIRELHNYLGRKTAELRQAERLLQQSTHLNHRQLALLSHALRHPDAQYTIVSHLSSHRVVYQTARTDLLDLAGRGLLDQRKRGRTLYFSPGPDLEHRIRQLS